MERHDLLRHALTFLSLFIIISGYLVIHSSFIKEAPLTGFFTITTGKYTAQGSFSVINFAPTSQNIPNQAWDKNTNNTINLSKYFSDLNNDDLNYSSTRTFNITISINNNTGIASLIPATGWTGTEYVVFTATDGSSLTESNNISLTVLETTDIIPPTIIITRQPPTNQPTISINGSFNETGSGISYITIFINASYSINATISGSRFNATVNLVNGWNRFNVLASDVSGNRANVSSSEQGASVLLDTNAPEIGLISPGNWGSIGNGTLISFKIEDLYLKSVSYSLDNITFINFNESYEVIAQNWNSGINSVSINATDLAGNSRSEVYYFNYTDAYNDFASSSIETVQGLINLTNTTRNNLLNGSFLVIEINNFGAEISLSEYNSTLQYLNTSQNLTNVINNLDSRLNNIRTTNSSSENEATKRLNIKNELNEIQKIKNQTLISISIALFDRNLSEAAIGTALKENLTAEIANTLTMTSSERTAYEQATTLLQSKTNITNKAQVITKTFLSGRRENMTLFIKEANLSGSESFKLVENVDKNLTGANNLNANSITNLASSGNYSIIRNDPILSWQFSGTSASIAYSVPGAVEVNKLSGAKTTVTAIPSAAGAAGVAAGAAGGGGVGAIEKEISDFSIDKDFIKISLKKGQIERKSVKITNTGNTKLKLTVSVGALEDLVYFIGGVSEYSFELDKGKSKSFDIIFNIPKTTEPGVYTGKILIGNSVEKIITVIIEIESEKPIFDVDVIIPPKYKQVKPGDSVMAQIIIYNLRGEGKFDVDVKYSIKDLNDRVIATGASITAVETQASTVKSLLMPSTIEPGSYVFYVEVSYNGIIGAGSDLFEVIKEKAIELPLSVSIFTPINIGLSIIFGIIILFMLFISIAIKDILYHHHIIEKKELRKEEFKEAKKEGEVEKEGAKPEKEKEIKSEKIKIEEIEIKPYIEKEKIGRQLEILEADFKSKLITRESYLKKKKKLEDMLEKV